MDPRPERREDGAGRGAVAERAVAERLPERGLPASVTTGREAKLTEAMVCVSCCGRRRPAAGRHNTGFKPDINVGQNEG